MFGWDSGKSTGVRIRYTMCEASCPHRQPGKQASGSCFGAACAIFRDRCGMSVGGTPVLWKPLWFGWNCLLKNVRNPAYERLWWSVPKVPTRESPRHFGCSQEGERTIKKLEHRIRVESRRLPPRQGWTPHNFCPEDFFFFLSLWTACWLLEFPFLALSDWAFLSRLSCSDSVIVYWASTWSGRYNLFIR